MRKTILIITLLIGTTNLLYAQNGSIIDTSKIKKDPPHRVLCINNNNIIEFTATNSGYYSITVENDGLLIEDNEIMLNAGESHIIDLSAYPAGTYRIIIQNMAFGKEQEYIFIKKEDNTETI